MWFCRCDCGTKKEFIGSSLVDGNAKSCGCLMRETQSNRAENLAGKKFSRLTAIKRIVKNHKAIGWLCKCECGNESIVGKNTLTSGHTRSCGCLQKEIVRNLMSGSNHYNWKVDRSCVADKHNSSEYNRWKLAVYERDNFRCQCCRKVGTQLNAHHILGWAKHLFQRYNLDNGITLCKDCHVYIVHSHKRKAV